MTSLTRKFLISNFLLAAVIIGTIAILFATGKRGFSDLAAISARNVNALFTAGELKSLAGQEFMNARAYLGGQASLEKLEESIMRVSETAAGLEAQSLGDRKSHISRFIEIHNLLHDTLKRQKKSAVADIESLYAEGFRELEEYERMVMVRSQDDRNKTISRNTFAMNCALAGTVGSIFLILLASFLYFRRRVISPIADISAASLRAARGEFEPVQGLGAEDEIGVLADNFNYMLAEIRRSSETIREERDRSERANRAKSAFMANMSHELRTPMHGILSYARFGQQKIDTVDKAKLKSYFDEIYDSGARLLDLLNDILDLSKLEAGKIDYAKKTADLADAAHAVMSELQAYAEEKKTPLKLECAAPAMAAFDQTRIMQVLRNLLTNAIKFSAPGKAIRIHLDDSKSHIRCRIVNQGVGIPAAELKSVFDKFIQSSSTRTGAGGTGLGLAICKEIVEQHGGKIWAESDEGGVTCFTFELPRSSNETKRFAA